MPVIDLGKVVGDPGTSMRFRGEWDNGSEYFNNASYVDTVTHHGSLWVCKQTNTGQEPIEGDYWGIGAYGTETGFDATITIPASGWVGVSAPFAQTVTVSGMAYNKAIVYAVQSNEASPTDAEKAEYAKITGISQNTDSITFYADEKPTADIVIRAFNGAGSEDVADLSVIAAPFDAGKDYTEGKYCMNEGQMWRFDEEKPAGAWDSSKVTSTTVADVLEAYEKKFKELNSSLIPEEIEIDATIDGIHAYRMGKLVLVFMENVNRPAWSAGYIVKGLPNPVNSFVAVGYKGNPFSFGDNGIYSDGTTTSGWDSFAVSYITTE